MTVEQKEVIFVTGGSGYIGRNLLRALVSEGHRVKALARSTDAEKIVGDLGAEPVPGDLLDVQALHTGMRDATQLIHAAADTNHGLGNAQQVASNLQGTRNVFSVAAESPIRRAVHLSTEAVLLSGRPLVNADERTPYPRSPAGAYSRTKADAEREALRHSSTDLEVIVVRPRFVWGRDDSTALPQLIDAAQSGKLSWIGGGHYKTSTTHIDNVVHGVALALRHGKGGEIYFITDGEPVEFRQFITRLLATQNVPPPTAEVPRWLVAAIVRGGDLLARWSRGALHGPMSWQEYATLGVEVTLNIDKARRELGYVPVISVEAGLSVLELQHS